MVVALQPIRARTHFISQWLSHTWISWVMFAESGVSVLDTYWHNVCALGLSRIILDFSTILGDDMSSKVAINGCNPTLSNPSSLSSNVPCRVKYQVRYTSYLLAGCRKIADFCAVGSSRHCSLLEWVCWGKSHGSISGTEMICDHRHNLSISHLPFAPHRPPMIPTVLMFSRNVFRHHSPSAYQSLAFPSVHPSILKWIVGIHIFCCLCWIFLHVTFVVVICGSSEVWFLHLLLDQITCQCCQTSHPDWTGASLLGVVRVWGPPRWYGSTIASAAPHPCQHLSSCVVVG